VVEREDSLFFGNKAICIWMIGCVEEDFSFLFVLLNLVWDSFSWF